MTRLELIAPELAEMLRQASPPELYQAVLVACLTAVAEAELQEPLALDALEALRTGTEFPAEKRTALQALAEQLDDAYLDQLEANDAAAGLSDDCRTAFSRARVASAIALDVDASDYLSASEAIYEAAKAVEEEQTVLQQVSGVLGTGGNRGR